MLPQLLLAPVVCTTFQKLATTARLASQRQSLQELFRAVCGDTGEVEGSFSISSLLPVLFQGPVLGKLPAMLSPDCHGRGLTIQRARLLVQALQGSANVGLPGLVADLTPDGEDLSAEEYCKILEQLLRIAEADEVLFAAERQLSIASPRPKPSNNFPTLRATGPRRSRSTVRPRTLLHVLGFIVAQMGHISDDGPSADAFGAMKERLPGRHRTAPRAISGYFSTGPYRNTTTSPGTPSLRLPWKQSKRSCPWSSISSCSKISRPLVGRRARPRKSIPHAYARLLRRGECPFDSMRPDVR